MKKEYKSENAHIFQSIYQKGNLNARKKLLKTLASVLTMSRDVHLMKQVCGCVLYSHLSQ